MATNQTEYKILILDDEYYLGRIVAETLNNEGFTADALTDVDSAIEKLDQQNPDIILSDIYLPGKNGQDFFNYCTQHHPELPFIFMTGNPNLENAIDFLKQGAYDYILKPFLMEDLIKKVNQVLEKAQKKRQEQYLVNDLKQILSERVEELQIFRDVIESTEDGLIILDTEGVVVSVNPGLLKMVGLKKNVFLRQHISSLNGDFFPNIDFQQVRNLLLDSGQWEEEIKGHRADGGSWIAYSSFFPIQDETRKTFAFAALIKDVTKLRKTETALIESLEQTNLAHQAIIFGLAKLAEYRDLDTGYHLERIRSYCKSLAMAMKQSPKFKGKIDDKFIETIYQTAPLHDIGKVGIPDYILLKKGKLTEEEYAIMQTHTTIGYQTLNSIKNQYGEIDLLNMGIEITHCHHERFDGKGYPRRLKGDKIPLPAQICTIADVYDALTTERVYKRAYTHSETIDFMSREKGRHFAPDIFQVFFSINDEFNRIRENFSEKRPVPEEEFSFDQQT